VPLVLADLHDGIKICANRVPTVQREGGGDREYLPREVAQPVVCAGIGITQSRVVCGKVIVELCWGDAAIARANIVIDGKTVNEVSNRKMRYLCYLRGVRLVHVILRAAQMLLDLTEHFGGERVLAKQLARIEKGGEIMCLMRE